MNAKDISEQALVFDSSKTVSKVAAAMLKSKKHEAVILEGEDFAGVVFSRNLAKRNIDQPEKTKIWRFVEHVNPVKPETSLTELINIILANDYKAIPVSDGIGFFFVTKLGILKALRNSPELKGKSARDVMNFPHAVSSDDSVATAVSVLKETGVSRLPIINSKGNAEGIVDSMDLLRSEIYRSRMMVGEGISEKTHLRGLSISSLMETDFPTVEPGTPLKDTIDAMTKKGMATAIVEESGKLVGIITPKPILRLFAGREETAYLRIMGLGGESDFIKSLIEKEAKNELAKLEKTVPVQYLVIYVENYQGSGKRKEYLVKARLITDRGLFFADDHAWDVTKAVAGILDKLKKEVLRKKGKEDPHGKFSGKRRMRLAQHL